MKLGPDEGNSGALVRWGMCHDNGVWLTGWKHRKLWLRPRVRDGYVRLGNITVMWGN